MWIVHFHLVTRCGPHRHSTRFAMSGRAPVANDGVRIPARSLCNQQPGDIPGRRALSGCVYGSISGLRNDRVIGRQAGEESLTRPAVAASPPWFAARFSFASSQLAVPKHRRMAPEPQCSFRKRHVLERICPASPFNTRRTELKAEFRRRQTEYVTRRTSAGTQVS